MSGECISVVIEAEELVADVDLVEQSGPPGASAYEVWLQLPGNSGKSVEDFIASLKGEAGDVRPIAQGANNAIYETPDGELAVTDVLMTDCDVDFVTVFKLNL